MSNIKENFIATPLAFFTQARWYDHLRAYSYGFTSVLNVPLAQLPPFQFLKTDGFGWANIHLFRYVPNGTDTDLGDIKADMELTGLELTEYITTRGYDLHSYPGTIPLPMTVGEGLHYLRFEDYNGGFVLSELFCFVDGLELRRDYVKVEWWHLRDFEWGCETVGGVPVPAGHIQYTFPYKNWVYLKTDIALPTYEFEEEVDERDGLEFSKKIIRYKAHRFTFVAPEYLVDAFTLAALHDEVRITHMGRTYNPDKFIPNVEEAGGNGNLFPVNVEFRTETTVVEYGRAYENTDYEVTQGDCTGEGTHQALAIIEQGSAEYTGGYFIDENGGTTTLRNGNLVIIDNAGVLRIRVYVGGSYNSYGSNGDNVYAPLDARPATGLRGDFYYYASRSGLPGSLLTAPRVTTDTPGSPYFLKGESFSNSLVSVVLKDRNDSTWIAATVSEAVFRATGVNFQTTNNGRTATAYKLRAVTVNCPNLSESDWTALSGVDFDEIENTLEVYADGGGLPPTPDDEDG